MVYYISSHIYSFSSKENGCDSGELTRKTPENYPRGCSEREFIRLFQWKTLYSSGDTTAEDTSKERSAIQSLAEVFWEYRGGAITDSFHRLFNEPRDERTGEWTQPHMPWQVNIADSVNSAIARV